MFNKDKTLYRIISGRTKLDLGGLFLWVKEAGPSLINRSYQIYDEVYEKSYMSGSYIDEELPALLIEHDIWFPYEEKLIDEVKKNIEDTKVEAFENYFRKKELFHIKNKLKNLNNRYFSLLSRKSTFDFLTCRYAAETARYNWLLSKTTYLNKKLIDSSINIEHVYVAYSNQSLSASCIRSVARHDIWRAIWNANKVHGGQLFNNNPTNFTRDQLSLCSYTSMYDNVYEHPESPDPQVIEDDDCLDGWFIYQRTKNDKNKKERQAEDLIKNPKIKNAQDIFIVTNPEDASTVHKMNSSHTRAILQQRNEVIEQKGRVKDTDFHDVQNELAIRTNKMISDSMKGR